MMQQVNRMPAIDSIPDDRTPAVARHGAIHCCQSGLDESSLRLSGALAGPLCEAITNASTAVPELASVELLVLTGERTATLVVHGSQTAQHNTGWLADGAGEAGSGRTAGGDELAALLQRRLPDWYGIERGTLVLDLIGIAAAPTSRLVYTDEPPSGSALESLFREIVARNHKHNIPTVGQLLVQRESTDRFRVTARVADIGRAERPLGRHGLAASLDASPSCPIDRTTPDGITSSRRLADDYWERNVPHSSRFPGLMTSPGTTNALAALMSLGFRDSTHEYAALLQGRPAADPYEPFPVDPTLALSTAELEAILDVTPHYETCRWPAKPTRFAPRFIRETVRTQAAGTDHEELLRGPHPAMTELGVQTGGSLRAFTGGWLEETGYHAETLDERSRGDPHFRGHPNDDADDGPVVLVDPNGESSDQVVGTAGELIMAANRALREGSHLLVVTPSRETAQWARDVLEVPYASRRTRDVQQVYSIPAFVYTGDGDIVVTERESQPLYWTVSDGQRSLYAGDRCLASGPVTAPLSSYTFETPRLTKRGDSMIVLNDDRSVRERRPSLAACATDYRAVRRPVLPIQPLFCTDVTVAYRAGSSLVEPIRSQRWDDGRTLESRRRHYKRALETFLETYTVGVSAQSSRTAPRFFERFLTWYDGRITWPVPTRDRLSRALPNWVHARTDTREPVVLENRSWWLPVADLPLAIAHGRSSDASAHHDRSATE
ncbi:hypothetical protein SAMN05444422_11197 [Halobiforma haloterrestris]|uniref:Uncharacterized protein n=2 Tax=Natronobacterium haloterrestre TaxID=148448 RepID=A0A1I1KN30_NATHA|nr:hypothetical protein SAMN05444422_11197 [Halobiforma haloterrestris]